MKRIYFRILSFMICFFTKGFFPNGPSSLPRLRFAASPSRCAAITVWVIISLAAVGCGYHFAGTGGQAPGDIRSVAVDVLQNQTGELGIEVLFTNRIVNEFVRWKRLQVKPANKADAILAGSVAGIKTQSVSHVGSQETLETRVTVTLAITLRRVETDEVLWQNKSLSYFEEYLLRNPQTGQSLPPLQVQRNRNEAFSRIAEWLAEKIHNDIFEQF